MAAARGSAVRVALGLATLWVAAALVVWLGAPWGAAFALALAALVSVALVAVLWRAVDPLIDLAGRAGRLAAGDWEALAEPRAGIAEVEALRRALMAMAGHVRRAQQEGQSYAAALSEGQETERTRLAHELHDTTVQALLATGQQLDRAGRLIESDAPGARTTVAGARREIAAIVSGLRDVIADLRPPALDELGLVAALEGILGRLPRRPEGITQGAPGTRPIFSLEVEGDVRRLAPERELAALRIVQEGISNVLRHAGATSGAVRLRYTPEALLISVEDNGAGFDPARIARDRAGEGHWGLRGLRERAEQVGGSVSIESAPGKGTRLEVRLPDAVAQPTSATVDPVCKATILPATAYGSVVYAETTYYFCCPVCQGAFQRDPEKYAR